MGKRIRIVKRSPARKFSNLTVKSVGLLDAGDTFLFQPGSDVQSGSVLYQSSGGTRVRWTYHKGGSEDVTISKDSPVLVQNKEA